MTRDAAHTFTHSGRSAYAEIIGDATGVTNPDVLSELEEVMRHDIFHSTLDWQTRGQLMKAAREAAAILDLRIA